MNEHHHTLKEITRVLLTPELDYTAVRKACASLSGLFCTLSGFDNDERANQRSVSSSGGQAISPYSAVLCITDMMRTRNFLQGIREAVEDCTRENGERPVRVLYAGCGPFATLLTPLITVFSPEQLQMVLLEINPVSLSCLHQTAAALEMSAYITAIIETDASVYPIPENLQPDIILTETMQPGLEKEPQVSIEGNLLASCKRMPKVIPERIDIDCLLTGDLLNDPEAIHTLQNLVSLDKETALQIHTNPQNIPVTGDGIRLVIPERPEPKFQRLQLGTTIHIYKNHRLGFNESGISIPKKIMELSGLEKYPATIIFRYVTGKDPGFRVEVIG